MPKSTQPAAPGLEKNLHCASFGHGNESSGLSWCSAIGKKMAAGCLAYLRTGVAVVIFFVALGAWFVAGVREWRVMRALGVNYEGPAEDL